MISREMKKLAMVEALYIVEDALSDGYGHYSGYSKLVGWRADEDAMADTAARIIDFYETLLGAVS